MEHIPLIDEKGQDLYRSSLSIWPLRKEEKRVPHQRPQKYLYCIELTNLAYLRRKHDLVTHFRVILGILWENWLFPQIWSMQKPSEKTTTKLLLLTIFQKMVIRNLSFFFVMALSRKN